LYNQSAVLLHFSLVFKEARSTFNKVFFFKRCKSSTTRGAWYFTDDIMKSTIIVWHIIPFACPATLPDHTCSGGQSPSVISLSRSPVGPSHIFSVILEPGQIVCLINAQPSTYVSAGKKCSNGVSVSFVPRFGKETSMTVTI